MTFSRTSLCPLNNTEHSHLSIGYKRADNLLHDVCLFDNDIWSQIAQEMPVYFTEAHDNFELNTHQVSDLFSTILASEAFIGVDAVFATIAQSLTNYFRTTPGEVITGTTESLEQYFHVRWEWLLVPLVMITLNTTFVLAVRLQSY